MFNALAFPGISDVGEAVRGLDDGGVRVFAGGVFEDGSFTPGFAVPGNADNEWGPAARCRVVDQKMASVAEGDGIDAGAWVRESGRGHFAPGLAAVFGPALGDHALFAATEELQAIVRMEKNCGLNGTEVFWIVQRFGFGPRFAEVFRAFQVNAPAVILCARRTEKSAV